MNTFPFLIFISSAVLVGLLTFAVRHYAQVFGMVARRDARHRKAPETPILGGTGIYLALIAGVIALVFVPGPTGEALLSLKSGLWMLLAFSLVFGAGVWNESIELHPVVKFLTLVLGAIAFRAATDPVSLLSVPDLGITLGFILWTVIVASALRVADGLDGLCSGMGALSALMLAGIMFSSPSAASAPAMIALLLAGGCIGFLFHNLNPARIYLGESGSLLIGFTLAALSAQMDVKRSLFISLSIPFMLLILPGIDALISFLRKRKAEQSVFQGDRNHLHQRLHQLGLNQRHTVIFLWACASCLNLAAYFMAKVSAEDSVAVFFALSSTVAFWFYSLFFIERSLAHQAAKMSQLVAVQKEAQLKDKSQMMSFLKDLVETSNETNTPFMVVSIDCDEFMKQMAHERPHRVVTYYVNLISILKSRLRDSDVIARISEHRFAVILPEAYSKDGKEISVIEYLRNQIKELQESYYVLQSDPKLPEGFRALVFPKDTKKICQVLGLRESELHAHVSTSALKKGA